MRQEDKEILLKDLCARLHYGFTIHRYSDNRDIVIERNGIDEFDHFLEYSEGEDFKPYLRPMSSMTEEEKDEFYNNGGGNVDNRTDYKGLFFRNNFVPFEDINYAIDWLNAHHFDYRGLIEKGLALEATEGMYEI